MKKTFVLLVMMVLVLVFSMQAHAGLDLIGQGTSTHGTYNLIYDNDLDITWYDYTTSATTSWQNQVEWADALSVTFGSNTYTDWRLPITSTHDCFGFSCTNNEMGHLYYTELGNTAGGPLNSTGDFQNLLANVYWSGTEYAADTGYAWGFGTHDGGQGNLGKGNNFYSLAVRPGLAVSTPVAPEPISSILFIVGGVTLGFRRFRKQFKK